MVFPLTQRECFMGEEDFAKARIFTAFGGMRLCSGRSMATEEVLRFGPVGG